MERMLGSVGRFGEGELELSQIVCMTAEDDVSIVSKLLSRISAFSFDAAESFYANSEPYGSLQILCNTVLAPEAGYGIVSYNAFDSCTPPSFAFVKLHKVGCQIDSVAFVMHGLDTTGPRIVRIPSIACYVFILFASKSNVVLYIYKVFCSRPQQSCCQGFSQCRSESEVEIRAVGSP